MQRLEDLERISNSFKGVEKSFAVQAGREIRIIVEPGSVGDDQAAMLAHEVARKIEKEMTYPGQIKVTVIRETRARSSRTDACGSLFLGDIVGNPGRRAVASSCRGCIATQASTSSSPTARTCPAARASTRKLPRAARCRGRRPHVRQSHLAQPRDRPLPRTRAAPAAAGQLPARTPGAGLDRPPARRDGIAGRGREPDRPRVHGAGDCPFQAADGVLAALRREARGRSSSTCTPRRPRRRAAMGWHLAGRVSAVVGSHTHVQTADERVLPGARRSSPTPACAGRSIRSSA